MKPIKTEWEMDTIGIYITPLIGYSNVKGVRSFWVGWLYWLWVVCL